MLQAPANGHLFARLEQLTLQALSDDVDYDLSQTWIDAVDDVYFKPYGMEVRANDPSLCSFTSSTLTPCTQVGDSYFSWSVNTVQDILERNPAWV